MRVGGWARDVRNMGVPPDNPGFISLFGPRVDLVTQGWFRIS